MFPFNNCGELSVLMCVYVCVCLHCGLEMEFMLGVKLRVPEAHG
jgi:hypothetical protein